MTISKTSIYSLFFAAFLMFSLTSCGDDDLQSKTFTYDFNTGQVAADFAYVGTHSDDLSATIKVDEREDGDSDITYLMKRLLQRTTVFL